MVNSQAELDAHHLHALAMLRDVLAGQLGTARDGEVDEEVVGAVAGWKTLKSLEVVLKKPVQPAARVGNSVALLNRVAANPRGDSLEHMHELALAKAKDLRRVRHKRRRGWQLRSLAALEVLERGLERGTDLRRGRVNKE